MARIIINTSTPNDGLGDPLRTAMTSINSMFAELYGNVVFKVAGKDLSANDFTDLLAAKLNGIAAGAEVNVQADLLQEDNAQDSFVNGKNGIVSLNGFIDYPSLISNGVQTFEIPTDTFAKQVFINGQQLFKETANNIGNTDTFSQTGDIVTINQPTETGNYIAIFYQ